MKRTGSTMLLGLVLIAAAVAAYAAEKSTAPRADVLYSCTCGPDCPCVSASLEPGKCGCGKALGWGHVLKIEGTEAFLCTCKEGCTCKLDAKDATKCGCGEKLKRVSLKGTGLYSCGCGPTCTCNTLSDKPGKCGCGKDLVKHE